MSLPLSFHQAGLVVRIDMTRLYHRFADLYLECLANCTDRGVDYWATSGFRPPLEQAGLWAIGRRLKENGDPKEKADWEIVDRKKIVTWAMPWESSHQYGIASDSCRDKDVERAGLQPGWHLADYRVLAEEATKLGLEAALYWPTRAEGPHVQLDLHAHALSIPQLKHLHDRGGMAAVVETLDQVAW